MCQSQMARAWTSHAVKGSVRKLQDCEAIFRLDQRPSALRQVIGIAQRKVTRGRERTSSGAEMSIRISCWTICAENKTSPSGWSGDTSASKSESQPAQKQVI